ncbi:MAG: hypothetical protein HOP23_05025 [Methylococcaceae bacterium]|nr:hypothetical protein [Methylococcaceae bacterium]
MTGQIRAEQKIDSDQSKLKSFNVQKADSHSKPWTSQHKTQKNKKISAANPVKKADEANTVKFSEVQKPLDLSVPFTEVDKSDRLIEQNTERSDQNYFASDNKKKNRPLQVDGRLLMSPEQESEKQKSADGAGIVIHLKP